MTGKRFSVKDLSNFVIATSLILDSKLSMGLGIIRIYVLYGNKEHNINFNLDCGNVYSIKDKVRKELDSNPIKWWEALGVSQEFAEGIVKRQATFEKILTNAREEVNSIFDLLPYFDIYIKKED